MHHPRPPWPETLQHLQQVQDGRDQECRRALLRLLHKPAHPICCSINSSIRLPFLHEQLDSLEPYSTVLLVQCHLVIAHRLVQDRYNPPRWTVLLRYILGLLFDEAVWPVCHGKLSLCCGGHSVNPLKTAFLGRRSNKLRSAHQDRLP